MTAMAAWPYFTSHSYTEYSNECIYIIALVNFDLCCEQTAVYFEIKKDKISFTYV